MLGVQLDKDVWCVDADKIIDEGRWMDSPKAVAMQAMKMSLGAHVEMSASGTHHTGVGKVKDSKDWVLKAMGRSSRFPGRGPTGLL